MHQKKCRVSVSVSGNLPEPEKPEIFRHKPEPEPDKPDFFRKCKFFFLNN